MYKKYIPKELEEVIKNPLLNFISGDKVPELMDDPNDPNNYWVGMPEFDMGENQVYRLLQIEFETEADYKEFQAHINQQLTEKTNSIWIPKAEFPDYLHHRYIDENDFMGNN